MFHSTANRRHCRYLPLQNWHDSMNDVSADPVREIKRSCMVLRSVQRSARQISLSLSLLRAARLLLEAEETAAAAAHAEIAAGDSPISPPGFEQALEMENMKKLIEEMAAELRKWKPVQAGGEATETAVAAAALSYSLTPQKSEDAGRVLMTPKS